MTAHGEANRQSPTARRQPTDTAENKSIDTRLAIGCLFATFAFKTAG